MLEQSAQIPPQTTENLPPKTPWLGFLFVIVIGLVAGFLLSRTSNYNSTATSTQKQTVNTTKEVGSTDTSTFSDQAIGTLEAGGLNGVGTHKLIRDGGPSQTVYLVSSMVDLQEFVGKKVQIWGQTFKAAKVSWLMDVGRVRVAE